MVIGGYFIGGYFIGGYRWLLMLLYNWLLVVILLMTISSY
jgi:hypothetical protein